MKALAQECALQGAQVILTARRFEELEKCPWFHYYIQISIFQCVQILPMKIKFAMLMNKSLQDKGRIDWLINNAGLSQRALIADTTMQTERAIMEVDYFSQVFLTKTVLPTFLAQKSGRITVCFQRGRFIRYAISRDLFCC